MNSIILCEGRTDAILLSYYLCKVYGWCYSNKPQKAYSRVEAGENQEINKLYGDEKEKGGNEK